ncbi:hypothetical protein GGS23DRAFT_112760 [Durotheca rogersii]|uniref:uncharacterized protein n=1 Tax=Durotheca rogersii TaxID=419775 RepID=UPI0022210A67|nr:uncharacterized protein GGS23DRAFT_112760 [Durotheca rogersii]KAI5862233.1 hypothetical protein GGS23DRAFT_112760 [Durotheca rogersii]
MGAAVSVPECQAHYNITVNCTAKGRNGSEEKSTLPPFTRIGDYDKGGFPGDPDIAGIGILGVFVAITSFAVAASTVTAISRAVALYLKRTDDEENTTERSRSGVSFPDILEPLILACSDQQVFTGAAYALVLRYWRGCTVSAYHYNIIGNMMLLTCATHLLSVTIVRNYWRFPWLACLRVLCITGVFMVTGLLMTNQNADSALTFPTAIPLTNETDSLLFLPAACFQSSLSTVRDTFKETTANAKSFFIDALGSSTPHNKIQGWNLYIIALLFYGAAIIAEAFNFIRRGKGKRSWRGRACEWVSRLFRLGTLRRGIANVLFLAYLGAGLGVGYTIVIVSARYIFSLRAWVHRSGWIQQRDGVNPENDAKSFGQLVPIFSSALIVFTFAQMISEKCARPRSRHAHSDAYHRRGNDGSKGDRPNISGEAKSSTEVSSLL